MSSQPRSSKSPNKSKRKNQEETEAYDRRNDEGRTRSSQISSTPGPSSKKPTLSRIDSTPRNERSLSQPPPTSIIRKQLKQVGIYLQDQPTSSTPAPKFNNNHNSNRQRLGSAAPSSSNTPYGTTPRRNLNTGERSHLLTSEKKRRSEEEDAKWTELKRRRSRLGVVTPRTTTAGIGGWAGGRDESPMDILQRLVRAPGFVLPPTPAGPTEPGLSSLRQPSTSDPTRNSIPSRLSGASSIANGSGTRATSRSSFLQPGMSVPGDLTTEDDGNISSSTRANDSQAEIQLQDLLNQSNSIDLSKLSQASLEELERERLLGRKAPKATLEGAGIFAHLLAKNAETGRRDRDKGRQSEGGLSVISGISLPKENEYESEDSISRDQYGTPSSNNIGIERGSDTPRSFLQNDSRLDALDNMTRESIFGGKGPRSGRESGASGRFSEGESQEEGLERKSRSPSRAASEPLSAGSAFDASQVLSDREDFESEDQLETNQEEIDRSNSLRSNEDQMLTNDEVSRDEEMPDIDDMPIFEDEEVSTSKSREQDQDQSPSKSKSRSRSRSPSPIQEDSISRSRSEIDDPDETNIEKSAEISLPSIERIEDDDEDGESSIDRIKKRRDAEREKQDLEVAAAAGSELKDGYETESDEESDEDDEVENGTKSLKGKQKEKSGSSLLKKRISRKKKRISPYTQETIPLLPTTLFKDLFTTFSLPGMSATAGRSKGKITIDPRAMEAVEDASYDWFAKFSQEISSEAERSGRKSTITEGDVVAVMKARGQIPSRTSLSSIARKLLPRELADLFAPAAPISTSISGSSSNSSSSKSKNSNKSSSPKKARGKVSDTEDEGNNSSSTIKAKSKSKTNSSENPFKEKEKGKGKEKEKVKEKTVSKSLVGKPQKVVVPKRKGQK